MDSWHERSIETRIHGRYLDFAPTTTGRFPVLAGFHGYGENAEIQMERLRGIAGSAGWLCVSIQGLHRFYQRRDDRVVANWMTRQDRDAAIADNLAYVERCLNASVGEWAAKPAVVFAGFSQGVAMAFRASVYSKMPVKGVIAVGGDIPPDISDEALRRLPFVLLARGVRDGWYTEAKFDDDQERLRRNGVNLRSLVFDGGHEWTDEVAVAASAFLREADGT